MQKHYHVYILKCGDNSLYTGITTDLERRVKQHNGEVLGGARYTKGKGPVELVYTEKYENRSEATKREYYIKSLNRQQKQDLIDVW